MMWLANSHTARGLQEYTIEELSEGSFEDVDLALFSAGGSISKKYAPIADAKGCTVVDNSSAFRMTEGVPLVVPEINKRALSGITIGKGGIVANPNCSTIIALTAVTPIHRAVGIRRMVVSTCVSCSQRRLSRCGSAACVCFGVVATCVARLTEMCIYA